jgi:hypothetical protein
VAAGCIVHIHEVIEKASGHVARCSRDDDEVVYRTLELPTWMFDRAVCSRMRMDTRPRPDVTALDALATLLAEVAVRDAAPSNAPVPGAQVEPRNPIRVRCGRRHNLVMLACVAAQKARRPRQHPECRLAIPPENRRADRCALGCLEAAAILFFEKTEFDLSGMAENNAKFTPARSRRRGDAKFHAVTRDVAALHRLRHAQERSPTGIWGKSSGRWPEFCRSWENYEALSAELGDHFTWRWRFDQDSARTQAGTSK